MKLKQIETLRAIMEGGSTMAAAATLGLSQSAVSRQLTQLEEELGFELFERSKGRLIPRPEAHALMAEVEDLAAILGRVKRFTEDLRAGTVGQSLLKVAVPHSLTTTALPRVIESYLADRPNASIELLAGHYESIEQMVAARVADIGFVSLPPHENIFDARPILTSNPVCILPKGHALAPLAQVAPDDLVKQDLILLGRRRTARHEFDRLLRAAGGARCRVETHSVASTCALVAQGLGVAIVPEFIARFFHDLAIETRPFSPATPTTYGIITLKGAPLSRSAEAFVTALSAALTN